MSGRAFWDGTGELAAGAVHFTNNSGELHGRPYARMRARRALSRWARFYTPEQRAETLLATIDNDEWLAGRNGCLVSALCRDVVSHLLTGGLL